MRHQGRTTRCARSLLAFLLLGVLIAVGGPARAQGTAASDSTGSLLEQAAQRDQMAPASADSMAAALADSAAGAATDSTVAARNEGFDWFTSLDPTLRAELSSNVTSITTKEEARAVTTWLDGGSSLFGHARSQTSYRQQDRDQVTSDYDASLDHTLGGIASLNTSFRRNSSEDQNRLTNGDVIRLEQLRQSAQLRLSGGTEVADGIRHHWALRGESEDSEQRNRGVENNRSLLKGGLSSVWVRETESWTLRGRFGRTKETGERELLGFTDAASATLDTLGAGLDVDLGPKLGLKLSADRMRFLEERLELARNSSGNIDTVGADLEDKVGQERESRTASRLSLDLDSRPFEALGVSGRASHDFTETQYVFSPQGIVQVGRNQLEGSATLRYAEAGSLSAELSFEDRYDDRRTRNSDTFRGRESRRTYDAKLSVDQRIFPRTDLAFDVQQSLTQTIAEEATNNNDRDRLVDRLDAKIQSKAISRVTLNAGTTVSRTREVNISAERVGNNKEDTLVEVRGGYTFDPKGALRIVQSYRLQIVFIDYFESDDRDQFNKQGQIRNDISYSFPWGPSLGVEYLLDFRKNGQRDLNEPYATVYRPTLERFDHQFTARVNVPWRGLNFSAQSRRGFLREQRGSTDNEEDRGEISMKVKGQKQFWKKRVTVALDLERILRFGPRVRDEQEDYWVAGTSIEVTW